MSVARASLLTASTIASNFPGFAASQARPFSTSASVVRRKPSGVPSPSKTTIAFRSGTSARRAAIRSACSRLSAKRTRAPESFRIKRQSGVVLDG